MPTDAAKGGSSAVEPPGTVLGSNAAPRARRPPGFQPPGPAPTGDLACALASLSPQEDLSYLTGDFRIFQRRDGHRWSLDDLVTSWVALRAQDGALTPDAPARGSVGESLRVLDLGCGIGSVLMMLAWGLPGAELVGVERQALSLELARRSLHFNGLHGRVGLRELDIDTPSELATLGLFDLVTGTPPYFQAGFATMSSLPQKGPCRFVLHGGIDTYARAARAAMRPDARLVICDSRLNRELALAAFEMHGLRVLDEVTVVPRAGKPARLHVWRCALHKPHLYAGSVVRRMEITVRNTSGAWTDAFRQLRLAMGMPDRPPTAS